jgi:hypothetical protein
VTMNFPGEVIATLCDNFYLVEMQEDAFDVYYTENIWKAFGHMNYLTRIELLLSEDEKAKQKTLANRMGNLFKLHFGIFTREGQFVGWHRGDQRSEEEYYMRVSGILPEFQGLGLYPAMLPFVIERCVKEGFQIISSKHGATNNRLDITEKFGTCVRLEYYTNSKRRDIFDYRVGASKYNFEWDVLRPLVHT